MFVFMLTKVVIFCNTLKIMMEFDFIYCCKSL